MQKIHKNGTTVSRVIVALNVGCDDTGKCYVSDGKRQGVHWTLLILDLKNSITYYGDSLGWPLPSNSLNTVGSNLKRMEGDLGINITFPLKILLL